ncbi:hypothetical protein [Candidatus Methylacidithermus pantelleriae]|uniref:hypothetical protein n=1 Tax=Candidatus Methylacidithermus pantelleriae TaxID=2744239 RepID=UPI00157BD918|nr:hypothetical protein [Candidatus Methylacidithermus pantelleriae]
MQVAHDIVRHLTRIHHHHDRMTLRGPRRFQTLETDTRQPVTLLERDDADLGITNLANEPSTMSVHAGADLL